MEAEYRAGPVRYRVMDDELVVALSDVKKVRIYTMQGRGFCFVTPGTGSTLKILSHMPSTDDNLRAYVTFIRKLHRKLATAAPTATYVAGHGIFMVMLVVCVLGMIVVAATFLLALFKGVGIERVAPLGATITLPLLTLAGMARIRPRKYSPAVPPRAYLPQVDGSDE